MYRPIAFAAVALAIAAPAYAQTAPWDGTWKIDTGSNTPSDKPLTVKLAGGTYECDCVPPIRVAADGRMHRLSGDPYADALAVTVVDPRTVRMDWQKGGKLVETTTTTLTSDNAASYRGTETTQNGTQVAYSGTRTRVAPGAAGSHALSGTWRTDPGAQVSDAGLTYTLATRGDAVTVRTGTGESFTARLGGPWVKIAGDMGGSEAKLERAGDRQLRQTMRAGGRERTRIDWMVAPDGRTLTATAHNLLRDSRQSTTMIKQ